MDVEVVRVAAGEWETLREVRLAALLDSPSAFGSTYEAEVGRPDSAWIERARHTSVGDESATFLARRDGRVVGLVGGYRPEAVGPDAAAPAGGDEVELVSMWVEPEARRSGAARLLVAAVVDWALETGARAVGLWVTRGNDRAHDLYASIGFAETGDFQPLPSDPCKDEIRMGLVFDHR